MRIVLVGNFAEDRQESMQRFADLLASGLGDRGHDVLLVRPEPRLARLAGTYRYGGLPKYLGYLDKFVLFPRRLRHRVAAAGPDVVHVVDHANAAYASACAGVPALATCHDLLQVRAALGELPAQRVGPPGRRYQAWIRDAIGRLPHAVCVSRQTRADVLRLTRLTPDRVSVIPNALNYPYARLPAPEARARLTGRLAGHDRGFLLNVGGGQWYKNRPGLLLLYARLRATLPGTPPLLLVGKELAPADEALRIELGLKEHVVHLGSVTNAELAALYSLADGLIFPSLEEGFGWPIAEAQSCGCPVFTSNRAPMSEVGGRSATTFDPTDPASAAAAIAAAWPSRHARGQLGQLDAARWAPAAMLEAYEQVYRQLAHPAKV
jgi:glycosyltransferase involved in cell wall biosynthesis